MSNYILERKIDLMINLLETLPKRIADEMDLRESIKKATEVKRIQQDVEFHKIMIRELNELALSSGEDDQGKD
jgi:hypothetical protein